MAAAVAGGLISLRIILSHTHNRGVEAMAAAAAGGLTSLRDIDLDENQIGPAFPVQLLQVKYAVVKCCGQNLSNTGQTRWDEITFVGPAFSVWLLRVKYTGQIYNSQIGQALVKHVRACVCVLGGAGDVGRAVELLSCICRAVEL